MYDEIGTEKRENGKMASWFAAVKEAVPVEPIRATKLAGVGSLVEFGDGQSLRASGVARLRALGPRHGSLPCILKNFFSPFTANLLSVAGVHRTW